MPLPKAPWLQESPNILTPKGRNLALREPFPRFTAGNQAPISTTLTASLLEGGLTLLDSFKRATEKPLSNGGKWQTINNCVFTGEVEELGATPSIEPGEDYTAKTAFTSGEDGAYWSPQEFIEPSVSVEVNVPIENPERFLALYACLSKPTEATKTGYRLKLVNIGENKYNFIIEKSETGTFVAIGEKPSVTILAGYSIRLSVQAGEVSASFNTGVSGYESILRIADSTYTKGFVGIGAKGTGTVHARNFQVEAVSTEVVLARTIFSALTAKLETVGTFAKTLSLAKRLTAALSSTGTSTRAFAIVKTLAAKVEFQGKTARALAITKTFLASFEPKGTRAFTLAKALTAKLEFKGGLAKAISVAKKFAAAVEFAGSLKFGSKLQILTAALTFEGRLPRALSIIKGFPATLEPKANFKKAFALTKSIGAKLEFSGAQVRNIFHRLTATVLTTGTNASSTLDSFKRAEEEPLLGPNSEWSLISGGAKTGSVKEEAYTQPAAQTSQAYWNVQTYREPFVSCEVIKLPGELKKFPMLWACVAHPGEAHVNGYRLKWLEEAEAGKFEVKIDRLDNNVATQITLNAKVGMSVGDSIALSVEKGKVKAWRKIGSGVWNGITEAADTRYTEGFIGIGSFGSGTQLRNFSWAPNVLASLQREISHALTLATLSFVGKFANKVVKALTASVEFAATVSKAFAFAKKFTAALSLSGALSRQAFRVFRAKLGFQSTSPTEDTRSAKYAPRAIAAYEALQTSYYAGNGTYFDKPGGPGLTEVWPFGRAFSGTVYLSQVNPAFGADTAAQQVVLDQTGLKNTYLLPAVTNLLPNASFEEGVGAWTTNGNGETELAVSEAQSYLGKKSLKVKINGGNIAGVNSGVIPVTAGRFYSASAYFYSEASHASNVKLDISFRDSGNKTVEDANSGAVSMTANKWGRVVNVKRKAPVGAVKAVVFLRYTEVTTNVYTDGVVLAESNFDATWPEGTASGYNVSKPAEGAASGSRFFDDNAWLGLIFAQIGEVESAKNVLNFIWPRAHAGGKSEFNVTNPFQTGGVLFKDPTFELTNRARTTTTNAATAELAAWLIELDPPNKALYKEAFEETFNWTKEYLYNVPASPNYDATKPALMFDSINNVPGNEINKAEITYNQGQMIAAAVRMYMQTKEAALLTFAETLAEASIAHFTEKEYVEGQKAEWNTIYVRGLLLLYRVTTNGALQASILSTVEAYADDSWEHFKNSENLFQFTEGAHQVITQGAMVQVFALLAGSPFAYIHLSRQFALLKRFVAVISPRASLPRNMFATLRSSIAFVGTAIGRFPPIKRIGVAGHTMEGSVRRITRAIGSIRRIR